MSKSPAGCRRYYGNGYCGPKNPTRNNGAWGTLCFA